MSKRVRPVVAIMYDFDKTLCTKDMQEYTFIPNVGLKPSEFWKISNSLAEEQKMDKILAYMHVMLEKAHAANKSIRREEFVKMGKDLEFFSGVEDWFGRINKYGNEQGLKIEHYIISSGLREIIEGSSIYKQFKEVFACEYLYDENAVPCWPKNAVNYTTKTQFLFRINKGVLDLSNDVDLNKYTPEDDRVIPFRNMIYIGDGLTDVPCMKLVRANGGYSIAVYQKGKRNKVADLIANNRVNFIETADYSEGSDLDSTVKMILCKMANPEWYLLNTQATVVDASQYTLEYTEYSAWETGFTGQLTLTPQVDCQHWELSFSSNREITAVSSAVLIPEGDNNYAITHDENNMRLLADTAYNFGIQGDNTEDPLNLSNVELTVVDLAYHLTDDEDANGIPDYLDFIGGGSIVGPTPTPTPVPTETPTITPTEEPTGTPTPEPTGTETPTPTEEPTPTPIIDYEADQDLDGLPDYIEDQLGTDPLKEDTDDDYLSDYIEVMIGYDPTNPDTDGNGITDGNEDCDNDGLSNLQEISLETNMVMDDTDGDHLSDGDEVNVYNTNPLVPDSDDDGIKDGDEVEIGKNPLDGSDGFTRISQTLSKDINNSEDPVITSVSVTADLAGRIDRVMEIRDYYNIDVYSTDVYGRIGSPINFECDETFDSATVVFYYDDTLLGDTSEDDLGVLWYDEDNGIYVIQDQAVVDTANNTITLVLDHFSTYVVVDLEMWNNPVVPDYSNYIQIASESDEYWSWGSTIPTLEDREIGTFNWWNLSHPFQNFEIVETLYSNLYCENPDAGVRFWHYEYTWLVMDMTDNDEDGVLDFMETQGILGTNNHIYYADPTKADGDEDGLSDLEEIGVVYVVHRNIDGLLRIIINGSVVYESADGMIDPESPYYLLYDYFDSIECGHLMNIAITSSDAAKLDSDGDYYCDYYDSNPKISDVFLYGLGDEDYDVVIPDNGNYISVSGAPQRSAGNDAYGGYQGWFSNYEYNASSGNTLILIKKAGCGVIAANDVRLYLQNGIMNYSFNDYRSSLFETYESFLPYCSVFSEDIYGRITGMTLFSAPPDPVRVQMVLACYGYDSCIERVGNTCREEMLSDIISSLNSNKPVILCEIDPTWIVGNAVLNGVSTVLDTDVSEVGFPIYRSLSLNSEGNGFVPEVYSAVMTNHYVTVTGVIEDLHSGRVWLRVQTWGYAMYLDFDEFYDYDGLGLNESTSMGSIIVLE